jgi:ribonuclease P protein component
MKTNPPETIKLRRDFLSANSGKKISTPGFILQIRKRGDTRNVRVGYTVTKKVGNAVVRNRTKRILREVARLSLHPGNLEGYDLVLIGRQATRERDFSILLEDFKRSISSMAKNQ